MSQEEPRRVNFRVVSWDADTQKGVVMDGSRYEYEINRFSLAPECEGQVAVGDVVSGLVMDFETVQDILIERGSNPIAERKEFFSDAGPYSEARGGWEPRGTPHDALNGGWPDTGDSRSRGK